MNDISATALGDRRVFQPGGAAIRILMRFKKTGRNAAMNEISGLDRHVTYVAAILT